MIRNLSTQSLPGVTPWKALDGSPVENEPLAFAFFPHRSGVPNFTMMRCGGSTSPWSGV